MWDSIALELDWLKISASTFTPFPNRLGNLVRLPIPNSDLSGTITDNDESRKAETTSSFYYLRTTVDEYDLLEDTVVRFLLFPPSSVAAPGPTITALSTVAALSTIATLSTIAPTGSIVSG
jgi:hypothetical protein